LSGLRNIRKALRTLSRQNAEPLNFEVGGRSMYSNHATLKG